MVAREIQGASLATSVTSTEGDDGIVAYRSAHSDEAVCELVARSSHSVQGQPEAIEEIRRIPLEHLATPAPGHP